MRCVATAKAKGGEGSQGGGEAGMKSEWGIKSKRLMEGVIYRGERSHATARRRPPWANAACWAAVLAPALRAGRRTWGAGRTQLQAPGADWAQEKPTMHGGLQREAQAHAPPAPCLHSWFALQAGLTQRDLQAQRPAPFAAHSSPTAQAGLVQREAQAHAPLAPFRHSSLGAHALVQRDAHRQPPAPSARHSSLAPHPVQRETHCGVPPSPPVHSSFSAQAGLHASTQSQYPVAVGQGQRQGWVEQVQAGRLRGETAHARAQPSMCGCVGACSPLEGSSGSCTMKVHCCVSLHMSPHCELHSQPPPSEV